MLTILIIFIINHHQEQQLAYFKVLAPAVYVELFREEGRKLQILST
jgi:hypothetical protein